MMRCQLFAGQRWRKRKISGNVDDYGCTAFRRGLLRFVRSEADPRVADCLNDIPSAQIANYESMVRLASCG